MVRARHYATLTALVVAGAGLLLSAPSFAKRARACAVPAGAQLVAKDPRVVVIRVDEHDQTTAFGATISEAWRYCIKGVGRWPLLARDATYDGGSGNIVEVGQVVLAGTNVAYTSTTTPSGGRYNALPVWTIEVRNAINGRTASIELPHVCGVTTLVLAADGIAAWQLAACVPQPIGRSSWAYAIQALDSWNGKLTTLASTRPSVYAIDPFAHLSIASCGARCAPTGRGALVSWTVNGTAATGTVA